MPLEPRLREGLHRAADQIHPDVEEQLDSVRRRSGRTTGATGGLLLAAAVVVALVLLVRIGGDGGPGDVVPGGTVPIATTGPGPSLLGEPAIAGAWTVTLSDADPGVAALGMAGGWTMRLGGDASIELVAPIAFLPPSGVPPSRSVYAVGGGEFNTNLFAADFAESCTGPGAYRWALGGDRLTLTAIDDTCDARRTLLATRPWTRQASPEP